MEQHKVDVATVEDSKLEKQESNIVSDMKHLQTAADEATNLEHTLTVKEAFKTYPMAVVWSILFCVCIIMDGYDRLVSTHITLD